MKHLSILIFILLSSHICLAQVKDSSQIEKQQHMEQDKVEVEKNVVKPKMKAPVIMPDSQYTTRLNPRKILRNTQDTLTKDTMRKPKKKED